MVKMLEERGASRSITCSHVIQELAFCQAICQHVNATPKRDGASSELLSASSEMHSHNSGPTVMQCWECVSACRRHEIRLKLLLEPYKLPSAVPMELNNHQTLKASGRVARRTKSPPKYLQLPADACAGRDLWCGPWVRRAGPNTRWAVERRSWALMSANDPGPQEPCWGKQSGCKFRPHARPSASSTNGAKSAFVKQAATRTKRGA